MTNESVVFVVDDDPGILKNLRLLLINRGFAVESYGSAPEFLKAYRPEQPGCLILDVWMPGMSGIELQKNLVSKGFNIPIIFLTGHGDISVAVEAMKQGAVDFLEKPFRIDELVELVRYALARDARTRQLESEREVVTMRFGRLTAREREVMALLVAGHANLTSKQIAEALQISHRTVDDHRAHIMRKMEAHSLAELVAMAKMRRTDTQDD